MIYSCLKVILDMLDKLLKPDVNALLHEFEFQVSMCFNFCFRLLHATKPVLSSIKLPPSNNIVLTFFFFMGMKEKGT